MKKRYIALFALLLPSLLVSCGEKKPTDNGGSNPDSGDNNNGGEDVVKEPATLTLPKDDEKFTVTSTLDGKTGLMSGDKGVLHFVMKPSWHIQEIYQNSIFPLSADPNDKFAFGFELMSGENTFDVTTYQKDDSVSKNGLLEGPDNSVVKDGTLTNAVDPKPVPGEIPEAPLPDIDKPTYKNGKEIYLITKDWWDTDGSNTGLICYDSSRRVINTPRLQGVPMEQKAAGEGYQVLTWTIDADATKFVSFRRTDPTGTKDFNGRTDILPVPDFKANNGYEIGNTATWFDKGGCAKATLINYTDAFEPNLPDYSNGGTIFFQDSEWWKDGMAQTFIACLDSNKQIINVPNIKGEDGVAMTHVKYDDVAKMNTWSYEYPTNTKFFRFKRYSTDGTSYWDTYTETVGLPDFPTHNGYKLNGAKVWGDTAATLEAVKVTL